MVYWSDLYDPCSLLYKTWDENMAYWSGFYDPCSLLYKTWDENMAIGVAYMIRVLFYTKHGMRTR